MDFSETRLSRWSQALSQTEDDACQNALRSVTSAIRTKFGNAVTIIRQGSYENRTNIRQDSDVDIVVIHDGYFFSDTDFLSETDKVIYEAGRVSGGYSFGDFRSDIENLLTKEFRNIDATGQKCIKVPGNTYRVSADVVPAFELRRFATPTRVSNEGIAFLKKNGNRVDSYPLQHYDNGVVKNEKTSRNYKSVVRILKNIRNELVDSGLYPKDVMSSFFLECLVWNVPDHCFNGETWTELVHEIAMEIWLNMQDFEVANDYAEVSDLRWLFRGSTNRTPKQAEDFAYLVWSNVK